MTLFDAGFRELLRGVVARVRRPRARPEEGERARRRRASSSGTFTGHRPYSQGDDPRALDWNVFARSGELFVKVLEEEQRRALNLLLDTSASMRAGSPPRFDGARRLAALLGGVALARLDGFSIVAGERVETWAGLPALGAMLDFLDRLEPTAVDAREAIEVWSQRALRGRVVWVSDFAAGDEIEHGLRLLGRAARDALALLPKLAEDEVPALDGYVLLRDPEDAARTLRVRVDAGLRAAAERELRALGRWQDLRFREAGVLLVRQRIPAIGDLRVSSWTDGGWTTWI